MKIQIQTVEDQNLLMNLLCAVSREEVVARAVHSDFNAIDLVGKEVELSHEPDSAFLMVKLPFELEDRPAFIKTDAPMDTIPIPLTESMAEALSY